MSDKGSDLHHSFPPIPQQCVRGQKVGLFFSSLTFSVDININKQKYFVEVANWRTKHIHQMIAIMSKVIYVFKRSHIIGIKLWCQKHNS